jgi:hypothetical protein
MTEDRLAEFLNKLNDLASDYELVVGGYELEEEQLHLLMIETIDKPKRREGTSREGYEPLYDCEDWIP